MQELTQIDKVDQSSDGSARSSYISQAEARHNYTVYEAFTNDVFMACKQSALGTCMISELRRFVEALEIYKPIADFKIKDIFQFSKQDDGLPKSIIL